MRPLRTSLAFSCFLVVVACAAGSEQVRSMLYGPSFEVIDDTRLQDSMWRLANGVQDLDTALTNEEGLDEEAKQQRVLEVLDYMADAAAAVTAPGAPKTGHTNVEMNIDKLATDIVAAKAAVQEKDYGAAERLPMACLACHQGQGGGAQN
jgi:hypothetical protein